MARIEIGEEVGAKKTFVWAIDWPGWSRGGKDVALAIESLIEHGPRYAVVAREAGLAVARSCRQATSRRSTR